MPRAGDLSFMSDRSALPLMLVRGLKPSTNSRDAAGSPAYDFRTCSNN
jgi:hypothetical protein